MSSEDPYLIQLNSIRNQILRRHSPSPKPPRGTLGDSHGYPFVRKRITIHYHNAGSDYHRERIASRKTPSVLRELRIGARKSKSPAL